MTIKRWLFVGAIVLVVAAIGIMGWFLYKMYGKADKFEKLYYACINSPADTIVTIIEKPVLSDDTLHPQPRKTCKKKVIISDTSNITHLDSATTQEQVINYYADTYKKDGIRIRYEAIVAGELKSIRFPQIFYPEKVVSINHNVLVHDTIFTNIEKNHLGIYGKIALNSFNTFPALEAGGVFTWKGRGGIIAGGLYIPADSKPFYFTIGGFFNLF